MVRTAMGLLAALLPLTHCAHIVHPGTHWMDTEGNRIEAHAAGMLQSPLDARWYWYGETKKEHAGQSATQGINCYSAPSIAGPWTFEGRVLGQDDVVVPGEHGRWVMQRPKVLFNNRTRRFVLWFHLDQPKRSGKYKFRRVGTATAKLPAGPFTFVAGFRPDGIPSLDMNLFLDPLDGQAYLIRDCAHDYVGISRLSADYLNTTEAGVIAKLHTCEGMAMFRLANGTYYLITSHLTGWNPNPLIAWRSTGTVLDRSTRWINLGNPTQDATSFNTQPTYVVRYSPARGPSYFVYMSDNWLHCGPHGLTDACYTWLPIVLNDSSPLPVQITWRKSWDLNDPSGGSHLSSDGLRQANK